MIPLNAQGLPESYNFRADWEVTPRQLKAMRDSAKPHVLIDCRTPGEQAVAKIDGAMLLPLQELEQRLEDLRQHQNDTVFVHCHHGGRSLRMSMMLRELGFADVKSLAGGIDLWAIDIDKSLKRY